MVDFEDDMVKCLEVLKAGGLILYPTDTVWGIGCDATNANAVTKIFNLKKREDEKAMIVLVATEKEIMKYVSQPDMRVFNYLKQVIKPTTVIYEGAIGLAGNLTGKDGSIAMRIVNDTFCKHLIKRLRKPLVSTSANISGEQAPENFAVISEAIKTGVDYIVQYRQNDLTSAVPSSIIKWNTNGTFTVIRL